MPAGEDPKQLTDDRKANLSQEVIAKAMQCETPEQLVELAKSEGIELTSEEAEAYLSEMDDVELDRQKLKAVAGGWCIDCNCDAKGDCCGRCSGECYHKW